MHGKNKYLPLTVAIILLVGGCISSSSTNKLYPHSKAEERHVNGIDKQGITTFGASVRPVNGEIEAKYKLAKYFQGISKHRLAVSVLQELVDMAPDHAEAYNAMGYSFDHLGDYKAAQRCYKAALIINPDLDHVLNNLGYSFILEKDFESAKETLKQAIAKNSTQNQYHRNLGLAYFMTGAYDRATTEFQTAANKADADRLMAKLSTGPAPLPVGNEPKRAAAPRAEPNTSEKVQILETPVTIPMAAVAHPINVIPVETEIGEARVEVLNGNGVRRLATNLRNYLKRCGVNAIRAANADHFGHAKTIIYYQKGYGDQAAEVAGLLTGANKSLQLTEKALERSQIRLLIGRDMASLNAFFSHTSRLEIANGNGVRGIARKVGAYLKNRGFQIARLSDADHFSYTETTVSYGPGQQSIAKVIAKELPGNCTARLVESAQKGSRIRVLLGSDMVF